MRLRRPLVILALATSGMLLAACESPPPADPATLLAPKEEQAKIRNLQTRNLEIADRRTAIRAVIQALQDLGFIIERANESMGMVTAARFAEPRWFDVVAVTVTVREISEGNYSIRANAIFNNKPVTDPEVYKNFFATLQRSIVLDAT